jgi:hypothetical protein
MGIITGYSRRTANIGGGGGGGVVNTIYSASDVIANQVREVTLYGNTSSDQLNFQNLAGNDIFTIYGNKKVIIGTQITLDSTVVTNTAIQQNLAVPSDYAHIVYNNAGNGVYYLSKNGVIESYYPSGGTCIINFGGFINFWSKSVGDNFAYYSTNSDGLATFQIRNESKIGTMYLGNAVGVTQTFLKGGNGSYHLNDLAIGATSSNSSAILDIQSTVKGFGLPAMTTVQKNAIVTPRVGLVVYDTTLLSISSYNGAAWV